MKIVAAALLFALSAANAHSPLPPASPAASAPAKTPCDALAADRKLTGPARAQFLKQCNDNAASEAKAACDAKAAEKKLSGAARNSFTKQCMADASSL
ncbi:MAG TPA: hypothetical protein VFY73_29620 [Ideonella sp.]|uniref:hypothetical protein n=1 Tax=Ideonella sp. TaxID=1929293 RepID=UPI002E2EC123|nr:hypothetical protein [Ideonella sp.]HEX5688198.1 hypothetical protein [Ideonella sp.]